MELTTFNLEKLYLDCIDQEGNCFVVYWADLRFSFLKLVYSGLIFSDANNVAKELSSFRRLPRPDIQSSLHFENASLQLNGSWINQEEKVSLLLFTDEKGRQLFWNCHHPKTSTSIVYKGITFQGFGYAETLSLPIKPWKLPIDELRWGRFLSPNHTIIWINWRGRHPVNKVIWNRKLFEDASFEESRMSFNDGRVILNFQDITVIREGKLTKLLSRMPWLRIIFNTGILNTIEIKYKARTVLNFNSNQSESGWSLFEIVTWKK